MSRIGKRVLSVPENVNVNVENNVVTVKGPKGELTLNLVKNIEVKVKQGEAMQDNRIPQQTRPMTEAEILRRRELRRAAIKKQKRRRTLFLYAFDKNQPFSAAKQAVRRNIPARR